MAPSPSRRCTTRPPVYPLLYHPKTPVSLARLRAAAHPQGDGRGKDPRRPGLRALLARSGAIIGGEAWPRAAALASATGRLVRLADDCAIVHFGKYPLHAKALTGPGGARTINRTGQRPGGMARARETAVNVREGSRR